MPYEVLLPDGYLVSDDRACLDIDSVHRFLSEDSYWTPSRARAITEKSLANSLCVGLYAPDRAQAGFARITTDYATAAHLGDVLVLPEHQGQGRGKAMVAAVLAHPELATVHRWSLTTRDAHTLYAQFGFVPVSSIENLADNQMIRRKA